MARFTILTAAFATSLALLFPVRGLAAGVAVPTLYLHLDGKFPTEAQTLMVQINRDLIDPLQAATAQILVSYNDQVNSDGSFFFNLVLTPKSATDLSDFNRLVAEFEKKGFKNLPFHFQKVSTILEFPRLQVGIYVDGPDDPFQQNFEISRQFNLPGLKEWNDFSNEYGFALLGNSAAFLGYVKKFVGDSAQFENLKLILAKNNMIAINPQPMLVLEDKTVVGSESRVSPFIAFRFFRNCYAKDRENGACFSSSP